MSRTILLTGKTGCGKSTIMHRLVNELNITTLKCLRLSAKDNIEHNYYYSTNGNNIYMLGNYINDKTSGIDAYFDKGKVADVVEYITNENPNAVIICEGWRYKNFEFDNVYYLDVSIEQLYKNLNDRFASGKRRCKPNTLKALNDYDYFVNNYINHYYSLEKRAIKLNWDFHKHETTEERETNYQNILNLIINENN